jgi:hypothetical protein
MRKSRPALLLCSLFTALATAPAASQDICKPILSPKASGHSDVVDFQRKWSGVVAVAASHCSSTTGPFTIEFVRLKEVGADLSFREGYTWTPGETEVSLDLTWDEWVNAYRIGDVQPCPCRR